MLIEHFKSLDSLVFEMNDRQMENYAETLWRDGVVVLPLLTQEQTTLFREAFKKARSEFPEFKSDTSSLPYVMGGFGAYGNPASFHNGYIRSLRLMTAEPMIQFFRSVIHLLKETGEKGEWYLEHLFDRMCCRPMHSSTSAESVHRDLNPQTAIATDKTIKIAKKKGDVHVTAYTPRSSDYCFGGWINLDEANEIQRFSCVIGSHRDEILMIKGPTESGFDTREKLTRDVTIVHVPSGHAIVFFQRIQHLVTPVKQKKDSYRQFRCYRIVRSISRPQPLNGEKGLNECIRDFGVPRLPSGQIPPLYGNNHQSFFLLKNTKSDPAWWSIRKVANILLQEKQIVNGKKKGTQYMIAPRFMTSLKKYDMHHCYPVYEDYEIEIMKPSRTWQLPKWSDNLSVDDIVSFRFMNNDSARITLQL